MPVADPAEILREVAPEEVPSDAPPESSNYRPLDMAGIGCANCASFRYEGAEEDNEGMLPIGICQRWEANVKGDRVCDQYSDDSVPIDDQGNEDYGEIFSGDLAIGREFVSKDKQIVFADATDDDSHLVWKEILREGTWPITPTMGGPKNKPFSIVARGESDLAKGIISQEAVEREFNDGVLENVQVFLTDEEKKEHKELASLNTGFVRKLKRVTKDDGKVRTLAGIEFTDSSVKEKIGRTLANVSAGIFPWLDKREGKQPRVVPTILKHVVLTNTPFIDGLDPFDSAVVASGDHSVDTVVAYEEGQEEEQADTNVVPINASFRWRRDKLTVAISSQLNLNAQDYEVEDISGEVAIVRNTLADISWAVPFEVGEDDVRISPTAEWKLQGDANEQKDSEEPDNPLDAVVPEEDVPAAVAASAETPLRRAQRVRDFRLGRTTSNRSGGTDVPVTQTDALEGVELSELPEDARARIQNVIKRNRELEAKDNTSAADTRIEELKGLGFSDPGTLKLYRKVFLADDGGVAAVLFSGEDDISGGQEEVSAIDILDRFIKSLPTQDGKLVFSAQHETNGNDDRPANDDTKEETPLAERVAASKAAISGRG